MRKELKWTLVLALVCVLAGSWACKLDEVIPPELAGPSELALSLEMRAIPDQLTADGFSSSIIEAVLRDENGQRLPGRTINFDLTVRGQFLDIGNLAPLNGPRPTAGGEEARAVSALTDGDGVARARYWAPFRTDQENDIVVTITGRPAGTDFRAALLRQVDIFVRAANRPSFPGGATCAILVEPQDTAYAVGDLIFFTAAQLTGANGNSIARYEWVFGDGSPRREGRNVEHAYSSTGTFTVTLFTTESVTGAQDSCTEDIVVTATGAPAPPAPGACPTASASFATSGTCDSGEILAGATIFFNASASTAGSGETITSYTWDFGDGTIVTVSSATTTHAYAAGFAGLEATIVLTVTNSCGETSTTSTTIDVVAACPP